LRLYHAWTLANQFREQTAVRHSTSWHFLPFKYWTILGFWCLIGKNPKFLQNFRSKNNTLKEPKLGLISDIVIQFWLSNVKLLYYLTKLCVYHQRKFSKLMSKLQVSFVNEALDPYCCSPCSVTLSCLRVITHNTLLSLDLCFHVVVLLVAV
jgi:hypothetical protein